jgi:hypothetical protein
MSAGVLSVGCARWRWVKLTERERFLLGVKEAATPTRLDSGERARLAVLRSPWWALWRWLPDLWRRTYS